MYYYTQQTYVIVVFIERIFFFPDPKGYLYQLLGKLLFKYEYFNGPDDPYWCIILLFSTFDNDAIWGPPVLIGAS